jgi:hypothetical protein
MKAACLCVLVAASVIGGPEGGDNGAGSHGVLTFGRLVALIFLLLGLLVMAIAPWFDPEADQNSSGEDGSREIGKED